MMNKLKSFPILLAAASLLAPNLYAIDAQTVADKAAAASYYNGPDGRASVTMTIEDHQGRTREREMIILRQDLEDDLGDQRFFVYFKNPPDVNRTTFLVWKYPEQDDDRWLYLPSLDLTRRIAASDVRSSFVGSHFFYEDVSGRSPNQDNHEIVEESDTYYVLKSTPKEPDLVEFAHYKSWIHRETFIPVKTEYMNASGEVYRVYEALAVETIQGYPTVVRSRMTDKDRQGNTTLRYEKVAYDVGLEKSIFTERYLRNPPQQYLDGAQTD